MSVGGAPILWFNDRMTVRTLTHVPKATAGDDQITVIPRIDTDILA